MILALILAVTLGAILVVLSILIRWHDRINRVEELANQVESKITEALDQRDNAIREMDACHLCWNDFTAKLAAVAPRMKNTPLFQSADLLAALIGAARNHCAEHDDDCQCSLCESIKNLN